MKKILMICIGGGLLLLAACGAAPEPEPTTTPAPTPEPTATLTEDEEILQSLVPSAEQLAVGQFTPVYIEAFRLQAVVPNSWPPIMENDALQHGWGINQLNFVAFDSETSDDPIAVLEDWVGMSTAEMNNSEVGFYFAETQIGTYEWAVFTRQNPENDFYAFIAVTVIDGEAYLMALFAPLEVGPDMAQTIIESVNILE